MVLIGPARLIMTHTQQIIIQKTHKRPDTSPNMCYEKRKTNLPAFLVTFLIFTHYPLPCYIYPIQTSFFAVYLTIDLSVYYKHSYCTDHCRNLFELFLLFAIISSSRPSAVLHIGLIWLTDFVGKCFNVSSSSCFFSSSEESLSPFRSQSEHRN